MRLCIATFAAILIAGCGQGSGPIVVTEAHQVQSPQVDTDVKGYARFNQGRSSAMATAEGGEPDASELADLFDFEIAANWQQVPGNSMRLLNFVIGEGEEMAQCYVTIMQGDGGGLAANVNRWLGQMGEEPIDDEAIANLPKTTLLGREATLVQAQGPFSGMGDSTLVEDAKLLGAIFIAQGRAVFVKFVGPTPTVEAEADNFISFCSSLRPKGAPMGGEGSPTTSASAPSAGAFDPADLSWQAAESWKRGRESAMRIVTYNAGTDDKIEISVIALPGTAGGVAANISRWYGQVGADAPTAEEVASLPTVEILGQPSPLAEAQGTYTGMGDSNEPDYTLIGAVCTLPTHSLFVKMTGPTAEVAAEKDNFIAFCESLALEE